MNIPKSVVWISGLDPDDLLGSARPSPWRFPCHPHSRSSITRRDFLRRTGAGAAALAGLPAILSACGDQGPTGAGGGSAGSQGELMGPGGVPLARRDRPVTLPVYDDNPPIDSGLEPETGGTLRLYNWSYYIDPAVIKSFEKEHGVSVEVATFEGMDEAIGKLTSNAIQADVFFPALDQLSKLAVGKVVQPLNLSYIPNLEANVWPEFTDPFYDQGSQYSVPYTVWTTGIGWRTDRVSEDIAAMDNPYDVFWQAQDYSGKVSILPEKRDALALSILRHGSTDVNTEDAAVVQRAGDELHRADRPGERPDLELPVRGHARRQDLAGADLVRETSSSPRTTSPRARTRT